MTLPNMIPTSTGSKPPYISASQIGQFLFCPLAYKYIYIDKVPTERGSIYTAYGSAIHSALEFNYRQKITSRIDLPTDDVIAHFVESFEKEKQALNGNPGAMVYGSGDPWPGFVLTGENVIAAYMAQVAPTIQPLHVELEFELTLKNYPITLKGFIDLIDENHVIRDYKTVGKTGFKEWTQAKADDSIQLTLYAAAFRKLFNREEGGIQIDLIPRDHKPVFKSVKTGRSQEQVRRVLEMATTIDKMIDLGIWVPNLNSCGECPFRATCPRQPIIGKNNS